ncbi:hypothetical protein GF108_01265 [Phyllobacterium sp. SYP-B3895]|uniref:hypothetical protein n=1 Tax=Phyllobacterium sp. SYP-B3895 TaxID=2663240 RepID=UPI001299A7D0|nr:hypothetical protein [Phyllobacterium sp. SYP-B3895]MRG54212.1 hypothetical protein [Phyllobacterium sp. SYP-B3895]
MVSNVEEIEKHRSELEATLKSLLSEIEFIPIGIANQFPYGWRKAAKGRTVWRLLEELISQNLELKAKKFGLDDFLPADSEVGVYDFSFRLPDGDRIYINVKSAVSGRKSSKDDISKAVKLLEFYNSDHDGNLFIVTIEIKFHEEVFGIELSDCYVVPVAWLPDVYVNPSNNGNLQSSKYKDIASAVPRSKGDFVAVLTSALEVARGKRTG